MTVRQAYKQWAAFKQTQVKRSTFAIYSRQMMLHVLPVIGEKQIDGLTNVDMQELCQKIMSSGVAVRTARSIYTTLLMVLDYTAAVEALSLPSFKVAWPSSSLTVRSEMSVYTTDEQRKIITTAIERPSSRNLGILLVLCTGMRIGEICALRWSDIDFCRNVIKVSRTVERVYDSTGKHAPLELRPPKTSDSCREIPFTPELVRILNDFRKVNSPENYVVSGGPNIIEPRTYRRYYRKFILEDVRLERCLKFHQLRHSFATRLVASKADIKTVSKIMGHSKVSITMDLYVHPSLSDRRRAIANSLRGVWKI